ncbi:MAG: hypothetical protein V4560_07010 [Bacteroidota bacterium]
MTIIILGILLLPIIILLNVLLFHVLIRSAIKRTVKPALEKNQLVFVDYKWVGFWDCGDFKNDSMDFALFKTSLNTLNIYSYLFYKDLDVIKRITIKIYVEGLRVTEVEFSSNLK